MIPQCHLVGKPGLMLVYRAKGTRTKQQRTLDLLQEIQLRPDD